MKTYKFTALISHDKGQAKVVTTASSQQAAIHIICNAEGCPEGAVKIIKSQRL